MPVTSDRRCGRQVARPSVRGSLASPQGLVPMATELLDLCAPGGLASSVSRHSRTRSSRSSHTLRATLLVGTVLLSGCLSTTERPEPNLAGQDVRITVLHT